MKKSKIGDLKGNNCRWPKTTIFTEKSVFGKIKGRGGLAHYLLLGCWNYLPGNVAGREMK